MQKSILCSVSALLFYINAAAQNNVLNGIYEPENKRSKVNYAPLRQSDLMWSKRMWRVIDLREKMNHPLYFPVQPANGLKSLSQVVIDAVKNGYTYADGLTAYSANDDNFTVRLEKTEIDYMLLHYDTAYVQNANGIDEPVPYPVELESASILRYRVKEDWFFDRQRSVMDVRIIGISPVVELYTPDGEYKGEKPLFWIYFNEARSVFANAYVFNRYSDSERRTLEDVFWKRTFSSYIYKESNVYDRKIMEYKNGLDLLLEAKEIKDRVFRMEQDFWEM